MLKITNGTQHLIVSKGAFKELYSHSGWAVVDETPPMLHQEPAMAPGELGGSKPTTNHETPTDAHPEATEEEVLQNMSEVELKQYASLLGIKTRSLKTREELVEAIKAHKG